MNKMTWLDKDDEYLTKDDYLQALPVVFNMAKGEMIERLKAINLVDFMQTASDRFDYGHRKYGGDPSLTGRNWQAEIIEELCDGLARECYVQIRGFRGLSGLYR